MKLITQKFIDELVEKLHKKNYGSAKIGQHLKEIYFLKAKIKLEKMYPFLDHKKEEYTKEAIKQEQLKIHLDKNKKDLKAKRAYIKKRSLVYHLKEFAEKKKKNYE